MRQSVCPVCRRPSETRPCAECLRDARRTFALGCERCGAEFTSRDETHRLCWPCFRALYPTLAELTALLEAVPEEEDEAVDLT